jgi:hypothetical protein
MNSDQYKELCRFYISRMLGVDISTIRSIRFPSLFRSNLPSYEQQIDLYWETDDAVSSYLSIANAKWCATAKVNQRDVRLLQQVRQKVAAHNALMITNSGFTSGAIAAAQADGIGLHLLSPSFDSSLLPERGTETIQRKLAEIEAGDGHAFVANNAYKSLNRSRSDDNTESFDDPDVELGYVRQLQKHLDYLRFIATEGYVVADSKLTDLEDEIARRKRALLQRSTKSIVGERT